MATEPLNKLWREILDLTRFTHQIPEGWEEPAIRNLATGMLNLHERLSVLEAKSKKRSPKTPPST